MATSTPDAYGAAPPRATYPHVRRPVAIGNLRLPHRVVMGSMHLNFETGDGRDLAAFYAERAAGGASLIITGGAAVNRVGAGGRGYALINEPEHQEIWRDVVEAVHAAGGRIALQLFHAGRYAFESSFGLRPVAPSAVYSRFSGCEPEAMSQDQIHATIADFAAGARHAFEIGFDAVEIMGSEGYLLNQFASPITNLRQDQWGGDAARRRAFPVEVVRAVRREAGEAPVLMRMSGADLMPGSPPPEETDALAVALVAAGADALDIGIGWHEAPVPTVQSLVPHGAWIQISARIKAALAASGTEVPVIASNRINTLAQADQVLREGHADLVSMARPFLADPRILATSMAGRPDLVNTCIGCNEACIDRSLGEEPVSCLVNPRAGRELQFPQSPGVWDMPDGGASGAYDGVGAAGESGVGGGAASRRRIAVVGAGPAGMEAARAAAVQGAEVHLYEAAARIGGQFLLAAMVPGKEDFGETVRYFEHELPRLGVHLHLGSAPDMTELAPFDHVVLATGVRPRQIDLPGAAAAAAAGRLVDYPTAFADPGAIGRQVAVIGAGGIAVDLAHLLAEPSQPAPSDGARELFLRRHGLAEGPVPASQHSITIMRRSGKIGAGMGITTRWAAVQAIRAAGVATRTGVQYLGVDDAGVHVSFEGRQELVPADTVIVAAGQVPHAPLVAELAAAGIAHTVVGGARSTDGLRAVEAFEEGLRAGTTAAAPQRSSGSAAVRAGVLRRSNQEQQAGSQSAGRR